MADETRQVASFSTNFFISYNSADKEWAEWIAWQLEEAGFSVAFQLWDFRPGENFILKMQEVSREAERTIAVLSPNYLNADFTQPEWAAAFKRDPRGTKGILLPIMVRDCKQELEGLLPEIINIDLVGLNKQEARKKLLEGINRGRNKPQTPPTFPGTVQHNEVMEPDFPGRTRGVSSQKFSEEKLTLLRPKLDRSFNPFKIRDEWIDYITSSLQEAVEREASLDFYTDDVEGHKRIHILRDQNTVYSLIIYKGSMGKGSSDKGISFSYAVNKTASSSGFNAWGHFKWDEEKGTVVLNLTDPGVLAASFSGDTTYTKEEFLHVLWDKIRLVIERSAH